MKIFELEAYYPDGRIYISYHTAKSQADKFKKNYADRAIKTIQTVDFNLTKKGVIALLNSIAEKQINTL